MPSRVICLSAQQWAVALRIKTYSFAFSEPQIPTPRPTVRYTVLRTKVFPSCIFLSLRCQGCRLIFLLWRGCPESRKLPLPLVCGTAFHKRIHPLPPCLTHPSFFLSFSLLLDPPCCPILLLRPGPSFQSGPRGVYQVSVPEIHNPQPPPQQHRHQRGCSWDPELLQLHHRLPHLCQSRM